MTERPLPTPEDDLGDALRHAVEAVRSSPPPQECLRRALARARYIGRGQGKWPFASHLALVVAAAAVLILSLNLGPSDAAVDGLVQVKQSRRSGGLIPGDDIVQIGDDRDGDTIPDASLHEGERELRRIRVSIDARIDNGVATTVSEHTFRNPLDRPVLAVFRYGKPKGSRLVSRTVRIGDEDPVAFVEAIRIPAHDVARVRLSSEETLGIRAGRLAYVHRLPRGFLEDFSFRLSIDETLADGAIFLPEGTTPVNVEGRVVWTVTRHRVRPSGAIIFLGKRID